MMLCAPLLAGWLTFALSQGDVWVFYLGRLLQGVGVMSSVTQVYLVEIADTERRGLFGASGALSVSVGITLVYCLGVGRSLLSHSAILSFAGSAPLEGRLCCLRPLPSRHFCVHDLPARDSALVGVTREEGGG